jgi:septal ring-binding cell division protein DamX
LSDPKAGPKVIRTKIPEKVIIAQKLFRGKIPAVDHPVKAPTRIESIPPDEEKAGHTQPIVSPSKQDGQKPESTISRSIESPDINEQAPPVAKVVLFQPSDVPSKKSEERQKTEPHPPAEPQSKIETIVPADDQSVSSQPTFAGPSEQRQPPEKFDFRQAEVHPRPVKDDLIEKTQERVIHGEKWLLSQVPSFYTIQIMGVRKEALLFNFVERNQLPEQNKIAFYQTTFEDKPWFQLLYGVYATKKDAQAAADRLPSKIRKSSPWIRRLSAVQRAIQGKRSP